MFNESRPFVRGFAGRTRVSVTGQIDEVKPVVYSIKIQRLRTAGRTACERQPALSNERINKAGFTDVASSQKRHLRQPVGRELSRITYAFDEFCFQVYYNRAGFSGEKNVVYVLITA